MDINNLISKTGQVSFYLTSMIMSSYLVSAFFYLTGAIAFQGNNDSVSRELLFKMDLPFETNESPNYELVVTTQFLIHFSAALTFGSFTALLLMVVSVNFMFLSDSYKYIFFRIYYCFRNNFIKSINRVELILSSFFIILLKLMVSNFLNIEFRKVYI